MPAARRSVLVIKLGALGDVVLALPCIDAIRAAHPGRRVTVLTAPAYATLVAALPGVEVAAFPRRGLLAMTRLLRWLPARRFDTVFDLQGSLRSRIMTLVTRAGTRVGPRPGIAYTRAPAAGEAALHVHAGERLQGVLAAAAIDTADDWRLPATPAARDTVAAWLAARGLPRHSLVLLHAGSSRRWPSKRWPREHFRALAQALEARGLDVVWTGGAEERALNRQLATTAGTDASGEFSYLELAALARHAAFAVTNDSGPMHILAAAGLPVYACFGPTDWRRSHAAGQRERVLAHAVPCSPCHRPVCPPRYRHACLAGLTPDTVLQRLAADGWLGET